MEWIINSILGVTFPGGSWASWDSWAVSQLLGLSMFSQIIITPRNCKAQNREVFCFGASRCKSLHLLSSFFLLSSFPHFPQSPVASPRCRRARCALPRGLHGRWSAFSGPSRKETLATESAERSFWARRPGAPQRWATAPRLLEVVTIVVVAEVRVPTLVAPPRHRQSSPHAGGLCQGFTTRWF